jgi:hypothetical protein
MSWTRIRGLLTWFISNGVWYGSGILGIIFGIGWALALFKFLTWIAILVGLLLVLHRYYEEEHGTYVVPALTLPLWVDASVDFTLSLIAAGGGHWFYGALVAIQIVFYAYAFGKEDETSTQQTPS